ncbi:hypothetical protein FRB90_003714 [Tulasnella sp. 427]|nr:hypothetical protein FRB90_003714 [Tulasnella sp. 427]
MAKDVQASSTSSSSKKDLDADQIQNLINMALSNAYDTVSSWLQPPSAAVIEADERLRTSNQEFEKTALRPARLGVGATAPSASTPKDVYKLKHKLAGTKRKADEIDSTSGKGKGKQVVEDDDDEESKSQSVSKKPKLGGASALLTFEPNEHTSKHKKKKKKKDKGDAGSGIVASPDNDGTDEPVSRDPGPSSASPTAMKGELNGTHPRKEEDRSPHSPEQASETEATERPKPLPEPGTLPSETSERKRKKKKTRKSKSDDHDRKSDVLVNGAGDADADEVQSSWEDDGEEWFGISSSLPPPESDSVLLGSSSARSKPTKMLPTDLKSTAIHGSRIHQPPPPRSDVSPTSAASSTQPTISLSSSPPQNLRTKSHLPLSKDTSLPTLLNGDSSSPHRRKKKKKRLHVMTQAQALDEQSSEATLVSSDHTARMISPRE